MFFVIKALSPQLIILRVAMGRAWTANTEKNLTTTSIAFKPPLAQLDKDRSETAFQEYSNPSGDEPKDHSSDKDTLAISSSNA